ncbi:DUF58 domain-containing protein [Aquibacillus koreensis]|uniref:DUF58 domain-containing protein n=1 Tax=Aquibacillus koreensis TaxID=279446 RepID=A0A9X3WHV0_9BACI|nr:DUF58 domain-containing protein [Aquibacillus koreensis]MCT2535710.1 DUF58 domain-containing protein [Aquibacillus koreensis]MDC3420005.1 DUF58 domain-containing protein [Aquibacillus koreensis]
MILFQKEQSSTKKQTALLIDIGIICIVFGIMFDRSILYLLAAFILAFGLLTILFNRFVGTKLVMDADKGVFQMRPGDQIEIPLTFENHSKIPIQNGWFTFATNATVKEQNFKQTKGVDDLTITSLPLSIPGTSKVVVTCAFKAERRGVTKISHLYYTFPNMFSFENITLQLHTLPATELVVYPEAKSVHGLEKIMTHYYGNNRAPISPFEDLSENIGTRNYVMSDSLQSVHWKASAKMQQLQTKTFERKWDMSWTIVINTEEFSRIGNAYISKKLEDYLSVATQLCYTATQQGLPFELHINIESAGSVGYMKTSKGEGKIHLKRLLNLLARVKSSDRLYSFRKLLHQLNKQIHQHRTIIYIGEVNVHDLSYLHAWKKKGTQVFAIQDTEDLYWIKRL